MDVWLYLVLERVFHTEDLNNEWTCGCMCYKRECFTLKNSMSGRMAVFVIRGNSPHDWVLQERKIPAVTVSCVKGIFL